MLCVAPKALHKLLKLLRLYVGLLNLSFMLALDVWLQQSEINKQFQRSVYVQKLCQALQSALAPSLLQ